MVVELIVSRARQMVRGTTYPIAVPVSANIVIVVLGKISGKIFAGNYRRRETSFEDSNMRNDWERYGGRKMQSAITPC